MKYLKWINENRLSSCEDCGRIDPDDIIYFSVTDDFDLDKIDIKQFFVDNELEYENIGSKKYPNYKYKYAKHKRFSEAHRLIQILENDDYKRFYHYRLLNWLEEKYELEEITIYNI